MLGGIFGGARGPSAFDASSSLAWDPMTQQAVGQYAQMPQQPVQQQARPSMFNRLLDGIQGAGAALRDDPGVFENYQNRKQQQQQFQARSQQELADYQRRIEDERNNWLFQQQYERANPKPINNDTVADYEFWKQHMSPDQFQAYVQNKADPPQYRQGPDGQFYRITPTMQNPAPHVGAVDEGYRFRGGNPADPNSWEPVGRSSGIGPNDIPSGNPLDPNLGRY